MYLLYEDLQGRHNTGTIPLLLPLLVLPLEQQQQQLQQQQQQSRNKNNKNYYYDYYYYYIFPHGATAPSVSGPPDFRGFKNTLTNITFARTLDERSARHKYLYLTIHNTQQQRYNHASCGIRASNLSKRAAAVLLFRRHGHWDQKHTFISDKHTLFISYQASSTDNETMAYFHCTIHSTSTKCSNT